MLWINHVGDFLVIQSHDKSRADRDGFDREPFAGRYPIFFVDEQMLYLTCLVMINADISYPVITKSGRKTKTRISKLKFDGAVFK